MSSASQGGKPLGARSEPGPILFSLLSPHSNLHLPVVAERLRRSKRAVVVTGAGISVSSGIPDFRSAQGLYNLVKERYPGSVLKGKDLFDSSLFKDPTSTRLFYSFMGELKAMVSAAQPTPTHHFIRALGSQHKLLRCYTQNIDGLESRMGMNVDVADGKACKVVMLHGDLERVVCTLCRGRGPFDEAICTLFQAGETQACADCLHLAAQREALGKRGVSVGVMRPNVVLYNEHHAGGDDIADMLQGDLRRNPDMLLVMGTTLKVVGIKALVKSVARSVRANGGLVIMINRDVISGREWEDVFDYFIQGECDKVIAMLQEHMNHRPRAGPKKAGSKNAARPSPSPIPATPAPSPAAGRPDPIPAQELTTPATSLEMLVGVVMGRSESATPATRLAPATPSKIPVPIKGSPSMRSLRLPADQENVQPKPVKRGPGRPRKCALATIPVPAKVLTPSATTSATPMRPAITTVFKAQKRVEPIIIIE